ncbi:MAG: M48 family metallopeptidase [Dehalococcoidia bacterium]|nr:M48 family metallopeptidase [Dehalococcoidia bacterium]
MAASTTFYEQQSANRRKSILLLFSAGVLLGVLGFAIGFGTTGDPFGGLGFTAIAVVLAILLAVGSYYGGDRAVLAASKAQPADEATHTQLLNVVREMTLAANLPMPKVYIIPDTALNAFATGRDPEHASIAVTQGLLDRLNREELQGVIAHELGHVRNFDIRFMLLIGVVVGGVALLADMFLRYSIFFGGGRRGRSDRGGGGGNPLQLVMFVLAIVLAILAPLAARLVQLSVSRQREYLADATAVELTRNPRGIEGALWKLGTDQEVLEVANRSTQHLYIVNPIRKFEKRATSVWATHPALVDRIDRLRELYSGPPLTAEERELLSAH